MLDIGVTCCDSTFCFVLNHEQKVRKINWLYSGKCQVMKFWHNNSMNKIFNKIMIKKFCFFFFWERPNNIELVYRVD